MKINIYHCNMVIIEDKRISPSIDKKGDSLPFPSEKGKANVCIKPDISGLELSNEEKKLLSTFTEIKIKDILKENSSINFNYKYLEKRTKLNKNSIKNSLKELSEKKLMPSLTINYQHSNWLKHDTIKGCILVKICFEKNDYKRLDEIKINLFNEIKKYSNTLTGEKQTLDKIVIMPDSHLTGSKNIGKNHSLNIKFLKDLKTHLEKNKFKVYLSSYGYSKNLLFAINAHNIGYNFKEL